MGVTLTLTAVSSKIVETTLSTNFVNVLKVEPSPHKTPAITPYGNIPTPYYRFFCDRYWLLCGGIASQEINEIILRCTVLYLEVSVLLEALLNSVNPKLPISVKSL